MAVFISNGNQNSIIRDFTADSELQPSKDLTDTFKVITYGIRIVCDHLHIFISLVLKEDITVYPREHPDYYNNHRFYCIFSAYKCGLFEIKDNLPTVYMPEIRGTIWSETNILTQAPNIYVSTLQFGFDLNMDCYFLYLYLENYHTDPITILSSGNVFSHNLIVPLSNYNI